MRWLATSILDREHSWLGPVLAACKSVGRGRCARAQLLRTRGVACRMSVAGETGLIHLLQNLAAAAEQNKYVFLQQNLTEASN